MLYWLQRRLQRLGWLSAQLEAQVLAPAVRPAHGLVGLLPRASLLE